MNRASSQTCCQHDKYLILLLKAVYTSLNLCKNLMSLVVLRENNKLLLFSPDRGFVPKALYSIELDSATWCSLQKMYLLLFYFLMYFCLFLHGSHKVGKHSFKCIRYCLKLAGHTNAYCTLRITNVWWTFSETLMCTVVINKLTFLW